MGPILTIESTLVVNDQHFMLFFFFIFIIKNYSIYIPIIEPHLMWLYCMKHLSLDDEYFGHFKCGNFY